MLYTNNFLGGALAAILTSFYGITLKRVSLATHTLMGNAIKRVIKKLNMISKLKRC